MCQHSIQVKQLDSRKRERKLNITGIVDCLGIVYAEITNDAEKPQTYFASVDVFGDSGECSCDATAVCYHLQALFSIVSQLPKYEEEYETTPLEEAMEEANVEMEIHIEQVAARAEKANELKLAAYRQERDNAYAVLATSKDVEMPSCSYCGRPGYKVCPTCMR